MSRVIAIASLVLATGFASGWTAESWRRSYYSGTFAQKQHCSALADRYRKEQQEPCASTRSKVIASFVAQRRLGILLIDEVANVPQIVFDMLYSRMSPEGARCYATCNPATLT